MLTSSIMDLPEMFISSLVSQLVENLAPGALSLIPYGGIDDKLKEWRKMLLTIEAVLEDAEGKQLAEKSIQLWLQDVQKIAYEIDDLVDYLATEAQRRQMMDEPESSRSSKIRKFVSGLFSSFTPSAISFNYDMSRKIDEITNSLKELEKTKSILSLREYVGGTSERRADLRLPSTSLVGPALVYGREKDSAAILSLLLKDRTSDYNGNLRIISIVGMGGIGKTTLAQSLCNTEGVKDCFRDRVWVCVAEDFDVFKISKVIYAAYEERCQFNDLNKVQEKLRKKLSNKKFLLVLDDVWNEDYEKWDLLCAPFRAGAPGSTIIVTTRSHKVVQTIGSNSDEIYELNELSDGDCLSLLAQHAFQRPNFNMHPEFKEVGKVIAKQCKGLPLAAKSLGGLLRTKPSSKQWTEVSTSKIWEIQNNAIIPALRLSYHHLPPYLKPLFAYCSLFPKGYEFNKQELIMLWMAQGFLKQKSGGKKQMEELGCVYFDELLSRSFFQHFSMGNTSSYMMHDLNNDLAQFVAGSTHLRLDVSNDQYKVSEEARHVSFISHKYTDFKNLKAFNEAVCLRTLLSIHEKSSHHSLLYSLVLKDFPRLLWLRALSFHGYNICNLPKSIGDLKQLRYLDFSRTNIKELPESVGDLYNLQTLLLHGCSSLVQFPASVKKLINLRHLGIVNTLNLKEMPIGIGMLTQLHTLSKFVVDKSIGKRISELKGLNFLQGTISISCMENVINVQDAMEANLLRKEGLHGMEMKWSSSFGGTREEGLEFEVLDALKPQLGLAVLEIEFYGGRKFPRWIGDHSFCDMVKVSLIGCKNCTHLPPLGQLASLQELIIEGMHGVKIVGPEFIGASFPRAIGFPSLMILSFSNMDCWEEWFANSTNGDEIFRVFPCLLELRISGCIKLNKVSLPEIQSLQTLKIRDCSERVLRNMVGLGSVKELEISDIPGIIKLDEGIICCLRNVENLYVSCNKHLRYLWEEKVACKVLEKMKRLTVDHCKELESLGDEEQLLPHNLETLSLLQCEKLEKMPNWQNSLMSLRRLIITQCEKLQNLVSTTLLQPKTENHKKYVFINLEYVYIWGCPSLKWFPTGKKLPTHLRYISVSYCENMEEEKGISLAFLEMIKFCDWSNLKLLPQGLSHLTFLELWNCPSVQSIPVRSLPATLLTLRVSVCSNLKYMCADEMESLKSLQQLGIIECENLENYPSGGRWPPNLESLYMGDVKQPITGWGLSTLPASLLKFVLCGEFPQLVSFSDVGTQLPRSLSLLRLSGLKNLESLREGLENLSSLQHLHVYYSPKLGELPEHLLPTLSVLKIVNCPLLKERCQKKKRDYWPKISHIPCLIIDKF